MKMSMNGDNFRSTAWLSWVVCRISPCLSWILACLTTPVFILASGSSGGRWAIFTPLCHNLKFACTGENSHHRSLFSPGRESFVVHSSRRQFPADVLPDWAKQPGSNTCLRPAPANVCSRHWHRKTWHFHRTEADHGQKCEWTFSY